VFAAQVDGKYNSGDYAGAVDSSNKAKKFAKWSAISTVIITALIVLLSVALAAGS
jgi:hypothetical protein